jgi:hypothetical protein
VASSAFHDVTVTVTCPVTAPLAGVLSAPLSVGLLEAAGGELGVDGLVLMPGFALGGCPAGYLISAAARGAVRFDATP